jgi:hypothetical protein
MDNMQEYKFVAGQELCFSATKNVLNMIEF